MNSRSQRNKWTFRIAALAVAFLPFLLLEMGLQWFGPNNDRQKLNQGLKATVPLFTFDQTTQTYKTSLAYQQFFAEVSFSTRADDGEKPDEPQKLIFVLGGSTVQGRPFAPDTAFPAWAELQLNATGDANRIRVVNCGGVSFASNRLAQIVPELLTYQPDLIVIATGHNEFLEDHTYFQTKAKSTALTKTLDAFTRLKTVSLIRDTLASDALPDQSDQVPVVNHEVKARLDNEAGYETYHYDQQWHQKVVRQFQDSVSSMVNHCKTAGVDVFIVDLASNVRDCAPFKSEHAPSVSELDEAAWGVSMQKAEAAMELRQWDKAIPLLAACVSYSPEHALTHFRLARCLRATKQHLEASHHFQLAIDNDVCPLRMKSELHNVLKDVCSQHSVPRLDCSEVLNQPSTNDSTGFGFDSFLDHVHPTVAAHQAIGQQLATMIQQAGIVSPKNSETDPTTEELRYQQAIDNLPTTYFTNGRRRIGWLEKWARAQKTSREIGPMTVGDVVQRIRRRLELRDDEHAIELCCVLPHSAESVTLLSQLRQQFQASGQALAAATLERQISNLSELLEDDSATDSDGQPNVSAVALLTDVQSELVREILARLESE